MLPRWEAAMMPYVASASAVSRTRVKRRLSPSCHTSGAAGSNRVCRTPSTSASCRTLFQVSPALSIVMRMVMLSESPRTTFGLTA